MVFHMFKDVWIGIPWVLNRSHSSRCHAAACLHILNPCQRTDWATRAPDIDNYQRRPQSTALLFPVVPVGFGLVGHLLEVCRGSRLHAHVRWGDVPIMQPALQLAQQGVLPGAVHRNLESYGHALELGAGVQV